MHKEGDIFVLHHAEIRYLVWEVPKLLIHWMQLNLLAILLRNGGIYLWVFKQEVKPNPNWLSWLYDQGAENLQASLG